MDEKIKVTTAATDNDLNDNVSNHKNTTFNSQEQIHIAKKRQIYFTGKQILELKGSNNDGLIPGLIANNIVCGLVGPPDSGKSQLTRQLALSILMGIDFLGYPLNTKSNQVLMVLTEDDEYSVRYCLTKQAADLGTNLEDLDKIRFIISDTLSLDGVISNIETNLQKSHHDLVIVDSYADLMIGRDMNAVTDSREMLGKFSEIARKFKTVIMFVVHPVKSSYKSAPSQEHVMGSAGFVQKVRLVMDLRDNPNLDGIKYLSVLKGNYVSRELKKKAIELDFSEETFTFKATGRTISISELNFLPTPVSDIAENNNRIIYWEEFINPGEVISAQGLCDRLIPSNKVSKRTAERWIEKALTIGDVAQPKHGHYSLPVSDKPTDICTQETVSECRNEQDGSAEDAFVATTRPLRYPKHAMLNDKDQWLWEEIFKDDLELTKEIIISRHATLTDQNIEASTSAVSYDFASFRGLGLISQRIGNDAVVYYKLAFLQEAK